MFDRDPAKQAIRAQFKAIREKKTSEREMTLAEKLEAQQKELAARHAGTAVEAEDVQLHDQHQVTAAKKLLASYTQQITQMRPAVFRAMSRWNSRKRMADAIGSQLSAMRVLGDLEYRSQTLRRAIERAENNMQRKAA